MSNGYSDWFLPNYIESTKLDPSIIPIQYFWTSEEAIDGEFSYCTDEDVALVYWHSNPGMGGGKDFFYKNGMDSSIGKRQF